MKVTFITISLILGCTIAWAYPSAEQVRDRRWVSDWLGLGEFFGTCTGLYKMCGMEAPSQRDCCRDWVCRRNDYDNTRYCMENVNLPMNMNPQMMY